MSIAEPTTRDAELADFEQRARAFLEASLERRGSSTNVDSNSEEPTSGAWSIDDQKALQIKIHDAGFGAAMTFPKEFGGHGLGEAENIIWKKVSADYKVPVAYGVSHGMAGPIINLLGTAEQKTKYLPSLWRGETIFAQMFSEPSNGSDVAGLTTKAEKVDGGWVMNGGKVWTSGAQYCDYAVCLARTNPDVPKHQGITMFILNLRDPAVTINPLRVGTGEKPFNQIFIDNLFVPDSDVLGEVDRGWDATVAMLRFERISIGTSTTKTVGAAAFENLVKEVRASGLQDDPAARAAIAEAYVLEQGRDLLALRMRQEINAGIELGPRGSIAKISGAQVSWRLTEILADIKGLPLVAWEDDGNTEYDYPALTKSMIAAPASWTAGGSIEIQQGIIGDRVLNLEKDPSVDKGIPFREIRRSR